MNSYTDDQLKEIIEQTYGFKKELILNPVLCGLWHVRFEVNNIRYYGWTTSSGALPQLKTEGTISKYHDSWGTPVTDEFYNEFMKGKKIAIKKFVPFENGGEEGEWEYTGKKFESQEEAETYINGLGDQVLYNYDFVD